MAILFWSSPSLPLSLPHCLVPSLPPSLPPFLTRIIWHIPVNSDFQMDCLITGSPILQKQGVTEHNNYYVNMDLSMTETLNSKRTPLGIGEWHWHATLNILLIKHQHATPNILQIEHQQTLEHDSTSKSGLALKKYSVSVTKSAPISWSVVVSRLSSST